MRWTTSCAFEIVRTDSLGIAMGGTTGKPIPVLPDPPVRRTASRTTRWSRPTRRCTTKTVNIADAYTEEGFDFSGTKTSTARPATARSRFSRCR